MVSLLWIPTKPRIKSDSLELFVLLMFIDDTGIEIPNLQFSQLTHAQQYMRFSIAFWLNGG